MHSEYYSGSQELIVWTTKPVNPIIPLFIVVTGDNLQTYQGSDFHVNLVEAKQRLLDLHSRFCRLSGAYAACKQ